MSRDSGPGDGRTSGDGSPGSGQTGSDGDQSDPGSASGQSGSGGERARPPEATREDDATPVDPTTGPRGDVGVTAELRAQVASLRAENERLQAAARRVGRQRYRRTALGLGALGIVAVAAAAALPAVRRVLLVLGAIGLFGAVLTYYLTPERLIAAAVGAEVYDAVARTGTGLVDDLGLGDERIYLPESDPAASGGPRLFVPQHRAYRLPDAPSGTVVVGESDRERGVSLAPTGGGLLARYEREGGDLPERPRPLATALGDAVVDQFELAGDVTASVDTTGGPTRIRFGLTDLAIPGIERFDHPVVSLVACGLATGLSVPVAVTVQDAASDRADAVLVCTALPERAPPADDVA